MSTIKHKVDIIPIVPIISNHDVGKLSNSRNIKVILKFFKSHKDFLRTIIGVWDGVVKNKVEKKN